MQNPITQFNDWFLEAKAHPAIADATAMTLATATPEGKPSARIVLLKEVSEAGFLFYTNLTSRKSAEIKANPHVALCFYWAPLNKQVRIEGSITQGDDAAADAYYASRPRERQIGAWASLQSQSLSSREELDARVDQLTAQYAGKTIPRPPHWSGWRLSPERIEFWQASNARLHERYLYERIAGEWVHGLLYP